MTVSKSKTKTKGAPAEWVTTTPSEVATWQQPSLPETEAGTAPSEATEELDGQEWAPLPPPLTLNITQHSGTFDPTQVKMLIYGETGMQKTRFASTFPAVIFADIDHGMSSVTETVDTVTIDGDRDGFAQLRALYEMLKAGEHAYETVVLDTLNEMQRILMRFTIEEYTHIRRSYGNLPGQSDYGKMLYEFLELTRDFINLPMRVVLLAQVNSKVFETDMLMPQLVGKNSAREILRKMDVVGYIYRAEGDGEHKNMVITFDSVGCVTKDRSYKLPADLVLGNPTFEDVNAYWESE
jgi:hypothetical protein